MLQIASTVLVAIVLTKSVCGKIFDHCEVAEKLFNDFKFRKEELGDWVCIAKWESHYNSSAVGTLNSDGSKDLGIFQISEKWWCEHEQRGKGCNLKCEDLLDDNLEDDIKCAKKVFKEHKRLSGNGFNAWVAWQSRCQGDLGSFIQNCNLVQKVEAEEHVTMIEKNPFIVGFLPGIVAPAVSRLQV